MSEEENLIGKTVRRLRKERGLTQQELSDKAGISHTTLWLVETGKTTPRLKIAEKLAGALEVSALKIMFPEAQAVKSESEVGEEAVKFESEVVDEDRYGDFMAFLDALPPDGLESVAADLREEQRRAVVDGEYAKAGDLYRRSHLVAKRLEELNPPVAKIELRRGRPAKVVFFREPTEAEREQLQAQYPGYVVTGRPVAAR